MTINDSAECLVKISYDSEHAIQKIKLSEFQLVKSRIPKNSTIKVLCYCMDVYKWLTIVDVTHAQKFSFYDLYECGKTQVVCLEGMNFDIPILPREVFSVKKVTFSSFLLGLAVLSKYKNYKVKWTTDGTKENAYSIKSYLGNKNKLTKYNPKFYSPNGVELSVRDMIDNVNEIVTELINNGKYWPSETYLYELLAVNWTLAPVVFSSLFHIKVPDEVSDSLRLMMYLMYGEQNKFGFDTMVFKKRKSQKMCKSLNVTLESDNYRPLLIQDGVPIRWKNVG